MSSTHSIRLFIIVQQAGLTYDPIYTSETAMPSVTFLHETGLFAESLSLIFFAIVQMLTLFLSDGALDSVIFNISFYFIIFSILYISYYFSFLVYVIESEWFNDKIVGFLILMDICNLCILVSTYYLARKKYVKQIGEVTLEKKFQVYQVYTWTKSFIPSILGAKLFRFISLIIVGLAFDRNGPAEFRAASFAIFNLLLDLFVIVLVIGMATRHRRLRRHISMKNPAIAPRTIDGKRLEMRSTYDQYVNYLNRQWQ